MFTHLFAGERTSKTPFPGFREPDGSSFSRISALTPELQPPLTRYSPAPSGAVNLDGSAIKSKICHDLSPIELGVYVSQKFLAIAEAELEASGGEVTPEAMVSYRAAAQANATLLAYTHSKKGVADTDDGSGATESMIAALVEKREARRQALARQYADAQEIIDMQSPRGRE